MFLNGQTSSKQNFGSLYNKNKNVFNPPFERYPISLYECVGKESQMNSQGVRGRVAASAVGEWTLSDDENTTDVIV